MELMQAQFHHSQIKDIKQFSKLLHERLKETFFSQEAIALHHGFNQHTRTLSLIGIHLETRLVELCSRLMPSI